MFLRQYIVIRPDDASQERLSWVSDRIQKIELQRNVTLIDLVKSFPTSIVTNGFDKAENQPSEDLSCERYSFNNFSSLGGFNFHDTHKSRSVHNCHRPAATVCSLSRRYQNSWQTARKITDSIAQCGASKEANGQIKSALNFERLVLGCIDADFCK